MKSTKYKNPNSKQTRITGLPMSKTANCREVKFRSLKFDNWNLIGIWCLVLGSWNLRAQPPGQKSSYKDRLRGERCSSGVYFYHI